MTATSGVPTTVSATSDPRRLLRRHCAGDASAFSELIAEFRRPVYGYLVRCGVAEADRDDLFQAVFLKIHASAGRYRPDRPAQPWIFTIVANEVRSYLRKRRVRDLVFGAAPERDPIDGAADGERAASARETVTWLEDAIRELPLAQRESLVLVSLEGMALAEAAESLRIPVNTVKTNLRRARLALAEKLALRQSAGRAGSR